METFKSQICTPTPILGTFSNISGRPKDISINCLLGRCLMQGLWCHFIPMSDKSLTKLGVTSRHGYSCLLGHEASKQSRCKSCIRRARISCHSNPLSFEYRRQYGIICIGCLASDWTEVCLVRVDLNYTVRFLHGPRHEKTNGSGFRPGLTQTRLYSHRR